jgi:hypothetical protein
MPLYVGLIVVPYRYESLEMGRCVCRYILISERYSVVSDAVFLYITFAIREEARRREFAWFIFLPALRCHKIEYPKQRYDPTAYVLLKCEVWSIKCSRMSNIISMTGS